MQNLYSDLEKLLKDKAEFVVGGKLNKSRISDAAYQFNETLLKILLSNASLKKQFFMEVGGATIFKQKDFLNFLKNKDFLPNSFTEFKNQIGLQDERGEYYRENKDVVLVFPFKDCVLEGGQDKEDQKRNEIFYNETLAPDEITRLFDTKALTNFKLYDSKGEQNLTAKTEVDFSKQNLIIKGNNLLALHSLKNIKSIAGQVKLIYIDPPYNTGNDSFQYNDKFNHSTWLTFMKNRLETASTLLRKDGSIWINIDDNEFGYLKVLLDEIFGRENYITTVSVKRSAPTGHKAINPTPVAVTDLVIGYSKSKQWKYKIQYTKRDYDTAYSQFIENYDDNFEKWKFIRVEEGMKKMKCKDIYELIKKCPERIIRFAEPSYEGVGAETRTLIDKSKKHPEKIFRQEREDYLDIFLKNGNRILFYKDKLKNIDGELVTAEPLTNIWTDIPFQGIAKEGNVILRKGKKPEFLLKRIFEIASDDGDLILDFHLGSGTTAAVAHKMKRRYIGIEQLEYEENGSVTRLNNVIKGDTTGVSKAVAWKGGGSFVYAELKRYNQQYIDEIEKAKDSKALKKLYEQMKTEAFFRIEIDHSKWNIGAFEKLDLKEQKELLCQCLDKNHLYVNLTEMEDAYFKMNKDDIALNKKFYNIS